MLVFLYVVFQLAIVLVLRKSYRHRRWRLGDDVVDASTAGGDNKGRRTARSEELQSTRAREWAMAEAGTLGGRDLGTCDRFATTRLPEAVRRVNALLVDSGAGTARRDSLLQTLQPHVASPFIRIITHHGRAESNRRGHLDGFESSRGQHETLSMDPRWIIDGSSSTPSWVAGAALSLDVNGFAISARPVLSPERVEAVRRVAGGCGDGAE